MNSKSKKILALIAASSLAAAGVAYAAVSSGAITLSPVSIANGTDLTVAGDYTVPLDSKSGFSVGGASPVMLESDTILPYFGTAGGMQDAAVFTVNPRTAANAASPTRSTAGAAYTYNFVDEVTPDEAGMINMADDQVLTIKPGRFNGTPRRVLGQGAAAGGLGAIGGLSNVGGVLRLNGGTTNLYAGNNNIPANAAEMNTYDGGTFVRAGRLNIAHSNAIGQGPLTLAEDTTLGTIETSNIDIGFQAADGTTSLNNSAPAATGVFPDDRYHQDITVARYDSNSPVDVTRNVTFDVIDAAGVPSTLRVYTGVVQPFINRSNQTDPADPRYAVKVVKTGEATMRVDSAGMRHLGGTHVQGGTLFVDGGLTLNFAGELGNTWYITPGLAPAAAVSVPLETNSAKRNYDAFYIGTAATPRGLSDNSLWGTRVIAGGTMMTPNSAFGSAAVTRHVSEVPPYMNTFTAPAANNDPGPGNTRNGAGFVNPLTIDANATAIVNRDQFIGDLNGAGTFEVRHWAKGNEQVIPQVTMQLNNTLSLNNGANADFAGSIIGKVNLVLDNPVQATGAGVHENQRARRVNFFPRTQALTGTNNITEGDTFIKDGTLSLNKASNIGPGTLRIGMYPAGYTNGNNGVSAGASNFRGFGDTFNVATFHGMETMTVSQPTIVYATGVNTGAAIENNGNAALPNDETRSVRWFGNNPENITSMTAAEAIGVDGRYNSVGPYVNIAATRAKTVTFPDITLYGQNGAVPNIAQFSAKNYIRYNMRNAMSINEGLDENTNWDGTVEFSDKWTLEGATSAKKFGFDVMNGVLHFEKEQQAGYALVGIRQGATLSFGKTAKNFDNEMEIVIEDDARIRVRPQPSDLATSLETAQKNDAVVTVNSINYVGLGMGSEHTEKRLEIQLDLSDIEGQITDQWIKVVHSKNAPSWNNIHFDAEGANGQNEHRYKVRIAKPDHSVWAGQSVEAYCDEEAYNIYIHIKSVEGGGTDPGPGPNPSGPTITSPSFSTTETSVAASTKVTSGDAGMPGVEVTFNLKDSSGTVIATQKVTTDANGNATHTFDTSALADGTYTVEVTAPGYGTKTNTFKKGTDPGEDTWSSGGGGCDAGFGAFALLTLGGAAIVLRKKD